MPNPSSYDDQSEWMKACMSARHDEHPSEDQEQSVAICMQMWRDRDKAMSPMDAEDRSDFMDRCMAEGNKRDECEAMWNEHMAGKAVPPSVDRAWSVLTVKSINSEKREIEGIATTPTVDRVGDIVEPKGAKFDLPLPLLWQHKHDQPVGHVIAAKNTNEGIRITARLAKVDEPGELKDLVDKAWQYVKAGLVRGLSIGFKAIDFEPLDQKAPFGGQRFTSWSWLETSLVTIPANADAKISLIKSIDQSLTAASGTTEARSPKPGASGKPKSVNFKPRSTGKMAKTWTEQIHDLEATRAAKSARMADIMQKAIDEGRSTDENEQDEFDELERELEAVDKDLKRFRILEKHNQEKAQAVGQVNSPEAGAGARTGRVQVVMPKPDKGIQFARIARCTAISRLDMRNVVEVAQQLYGDRDPDIVECVKTPVNAATTFSPNWAGNLVGTNFAVAADFIEYLRPRTILGQFGANGVPALRRVPFRVALVGQTSGGAGYWVGEAAAKPLTKFDFSRTSLEPLKVANIAVLTEEVIRDSSPSAEAIVRDQLAAAVAERLDIDFIDPGKAVSAGVSPASITNGISPTAASGNDLTNLYADVQAVFNTFIGNNNTLSTGVWIMRETVALTISMLRDSLGQLVFPTMTPRGGTFYGLPVIASQYVPVTSAASPTDSSIVLVNAEDIYLADEGGVNVDMSRETSLVMDNAPQALMTSSGAGGSPNAPTAASMVSMFQTNSVALRAERTINWARRRTGAVAMISGAAYILG